MNFRIGPGDTLRIQIVIGGQTLLDHLKGIIERVLAEIFVIFVLMLVMMLLVWDADHSGFRIPLPLWSLKLIHDHSVVSTCSLNVFDWGLHLDDWVFNSDAAVSIALDFSGVSFRFVESVVEAHFFDVDEMSFLFLRDRSQRRLQLICHLHRPRNFIQLSPCGIESSWLHLTSFKFQLCCSELPILWLPQRRRPSNHLMCVSGFLCMLVARLCLPSSDVGSAWS